MKKWISILSGLLMVQLVLAVAVYRSGEEYRAFQAEEKLVVFDRQQVDGLSIEDGEESLILNKRDAKWLLPESGGFPASQGSIDRLLDKLSDLEKGWPVATTSGAARRFKVAEGEFERKLTLFSNEEVLAELYVGTSPGFRKVHVRPANENAVFAVAFESWEANAKRDDWIDKGVLKFDQGEVERVELPGFVLQRQEGQLQLADLGEMEQMKGEETRSLIARLAGLGIQSLLDNEARPEYRQDQPEFEVKVAFKGGDVLGYRFSKPEEGDHYVLKRSDLDHYFEVAEFVVTPIKDAAREKLVQAKNEEMPSEAAEGESQVAETQ